MIVFSLKLLNNVRKAIAGRKFPKQLAGGVALGALLGVVPHGNLLALFILTAILCFRVNHALMAVVAIAVSFVATNLDPYSHLVGEYLLMHPRGRELATQAWSLPVMPWTDLNNTVVLGSFVIGLASTLPIYYLTLPLFKLIAPAESEEESTRGASDQRFDEPHGLQAPTDAAATKEAATKETVKPQADQAAAQPHSVTLFVDQEQAVPPPRFASTAETSTAETTTANDSDSEQETPETRIDRVEEDDTTKAASELAPEAQGDDLVSVETRIDVIRMKDFREDTESVDASDDANSNKNNEQPMDEALNYLLRQLRHSQERKAAG